MYKNKGFILPMIMTFIIIISIVGTSLVQVAIQANGSAVRHTQVQIAHIASKAAIDYATEQYDLNADYNGTTEQDLFSNNFYRATIEVVVLFSQGPSAKRVQGIGRVYIPTLATNAKVVRDIKATIIRSGEHVNDNNDNNDNDNDTTNPDSFNPLLWLDANESDTLYKSNASNTQTVSSLYGNGNSVVEERGSDASKKQGKLSSGGDDLEMSWDGNSKGHQTIGLRFKSIVTPQAATIQNSYIQFTTDETKSAGAVQLLVQGVSQDNPGAWSGDYAVTNAAKTTASVTWQPANWNIVGSSGANERVDVTAIVQELVNRAGWANGNSMAFSISWITGNGVRTAEKGKNGSDPKLFIQWAGGGGGVTKATADGDSIDQWYDRSSNNNNAVFTYGTRPILKLNQVNGKNAVRFSSNGALLSAINSLSDRELVAFMVMAPRTTSSTDARFLSVMNTAQNDDNNTPDGLVPFMKSGSSSTLQQVYDNTTGRTIVNAIDGNWGAFTSRMSDLYSERLLKNSNPDNYNPDFTVNYTVDQIYLGGRRSGSVGADYADMDVAEVLVYDRAFVCSELQLIENYFKSKYNFSYVDKNPCP